MAENSLSPSSTHVTEVLAEGERPQLQKIKRYSGLESVQGRKFLRSKLWVYICYSPREHRQSDEILVLLVINNKIYILGFLHEWFWLFAADSL